jgi:hypothetical protein
MTTSTALQYATYHEARIARKIVKDALANGWTISVYDGEEWPLKSSTDSRAILEAMCSTDSDMLRLRDAAGEVIGNIWLVWGNDEDVISDHSDSEAMADFMAGRY